jgi:hypothetical protein
MHTVHPLFEQMIRLDIEQNRWPYNPMMRTALLIVFGALMCVGCSRESQIKSEAKQYDWSTQLTRHTGETVIKGMLIDGSAVSADPLKPAFMAPPPGSKPYHGFPLVTDVAVDGFSLGTVTDYMQSDSPSGCTIGDAFVEAPDGTRAGLMWEVGAERGFARIASPDGNRWGVYYFSVPNPVKSKSDFRENFVGMLPKLKELHSEAQKTGGLTR